MSKLFVIIQREYLERVRKKSFIIATLLMPLFMLALMTVPAIIAIKTAPGTKSVKVVDCSPGKAVSSLLLSDRVVDYTVLDMSREEALVRYSDSNESYGILYIGPDILENPSDIQLFTNGSVSVDVENTLENDVSNILTDFKIKSYQIENLEKIISESRVRVSLGSSFKNDGSGSTENLSKNSAVASSILSIVLGITLYMIILLYGSMLLNNVIEEKQSRVVDILLTTTRPFDMMLGKILGVAAVACTQILIWAAIIVMGVLFIIPVIVSSEVGAAEALASSGLAEFLNLGFVIKTFTMLFIYLIGGFLLYAALYAAVGSSVDCPQDAAQFNGIITIPIIISVMIMVMVSRDPDSALVMWCSIIPFTSPIIMLARVPYDVPLWQIIVSVIILYATFVAMVWVSSRIYRVGLLMHGKKPTFKDLAKWIVEK